ncbi:hypothetical protein FACS1894187_10460 [Synergistales bacterium]|nr:hypothetical protein FACS1894187_10460 [Synergistales bacterium]
MNNLSKLRKKANLTQAGLAKEIGVEMNTVWKWENSNAMPSVETVQRLASFFNCTVDEVLNGPSGKQLTITIDLEGVDEMTNEAITAEGVFFGYRAADDAYVIRGAIPAEGKSEEEIISSTLAEMAKQLRAAFAGRKSYRE